MTNGCRRLLRCSSRKVGDWVRFFAEVEKLGGLPSGERKAKLKALVESQNSSD
jgi:predicted aminopeptidase